MNDILDQLTNKGVAVNVNVKLDSKTLLQLFITLAAAAFSAIVMYYLFQALTSTSK